MTRVQLFAVLGTNPRGLVPGMKPPRVPGSSLVAIASVQGGRLFSHGLLAACLAALAPTVAWGIEAAFVPAVDGGGEYLVRVEPDLVRGGTPYTFTSDVPADARDVRRVKIYVAEVWPPAVERSVAEASRRPRVAPAAVAGAPRLPDVEPMAVVKDARPWGWLTGSLVGLFLSLGANAYLALLLESMRRRYRDDIETVSEG